MIECDGELDVLVVFIVELVVFMDGACLANGREGATAGVGVAWGVEHYQMCSSPVDSALDSHP